MKTNLLAALAAVTLAVPMTATAANAQRDDRGYQRDDRDYQWHGDRQDWDASRDYRPGRYRERALTRDDRVYRGQDGRTYCRRNDGSTGLVVGAVGGGVLGNVLGGGTLGTLLGAGGGALLGRNIDRGKVRCR
ncbi:glycine zipper 2TM domain-containing protein [Sphingomonas sp. GV3]|uniref:glycine zipper 2TM domain-containing protein n=1 Tax=Sphingomonas sp. GV3 TaxID=3040671 RepID=UPI00280AFD38|nr:glycine zipper 2TM domain-containing protein [Sphingomonas sp. GV3]